MAKIRIRSTTYRAWEGMKQRCKATTHPRYQDWGGRGISYPATWETYSGFLADMGECPYGYSLDRINNNKGYSKDNCRWADASTQNHNRRTPKTNTSGVKGVSFSIKSRRWQATVKDGGKSKSLYSGLSFFEAICARKSWNAQHSYKLGDAL